MIYEYTKTYDDEERGDYGPVTIHTEILYFYNKLLKKQNANIGRTIAKERTISVSGAVLPLATTKGRKSAPESAGGFRIAMSKRKAPKKWRQISPYNTGFPNIDKGHVMALELGGPDVSHNIVPQYSKYQQSGVWRNMETEAHNLAVGLEEFGQRAIYSVYVHYCKGKTFRRQLTPSGFTVELQNATSGETLFEYFIDNAQNESDDMMGFRVMDPLDAQILVDDEMFDHEAGTSSTSVDAVPMDGCSATGRSEYVDRNRWVADRDRNARFVNDIDAAGEFSGDDDDYWNDDLADMEP